MKLVKLITCLFIAAFVSACGGKERSEFETESGMILPGELQQVQSVDDGKFVRTTVYQSNPQTVKDFIAANNFQLFTRADITQFWGVNYLKLKPDYSKPGSVYFKSGFSGKTSWICIAEISSARIFTEVKYPGKTVY